MHYLLLNDHAVTCHAYPVLRARPQLPDFTKKTAAAKGQKSIHSGWLWGLGGSNKKPAGSWQIDVYVDCIFSPFWLSAFDLCALEFFCFCFPRNELVLRAVVCQGSKSHRPGLRIRKRVAPFDVETSASQPGSPGLGIRRGRCLLHPGHNQTQNCTVSVSYWSPGLHAGSIAAGLPSRRARLDLYETHQGRTV